MPNGAFCACKGDLDSSVAPVCLVRVTVRRYFISVAQRLSLVKPLIVVNITGKQEQMIPTPNSQQLQTISLGHLVPRRSQHVQVVRTTEVRICLPKSVYWHCIPCCVSVSSEDDSEVHTSQRTTTGTRKFDVSACNIVLVFRAPILLGKHSQQSSQKNGHDSKFATQFQLKLPYGKRGDREDC